ncbi:DNA/RNA helicase (SNF2 family) protein [Gracilibacillus halophilus YIM-C55.5]|uniref:DNA/RNA helicase (SNF2 family) protein n=1 Tax=Gracilibacillus halophilus YIM-C55.5 TaxID=1308866 RepID=N4WWJ8_9BACI|nr:SNF2-related protein [Gracilibacillus halophilus]ENH97451.1 DNA/RNA helicase (SNF2 family) protein [Gracilibacillus halophilus YIM-C55.5]
MNIEIEHDALALDSFLEMMNDPKQTTDWELFQKSYQIAETMKVPDFDQLVAPKFLPDLSLLPHQLECAERVIQDMNGRALLADEVGLGKTIEAGLILKEYMLRGLVKKVLILVPASLVNQWAIELNQKFRIPAVTARKRIHWKETNILITTLDTAKQSKHRKEVLEQDYDFVIIDEAHKLKNHKTKNFSLVQSIKKKYCLLLTATPIQNRLSDIFNLISLLKPGYLGTYDEFMKTYRHQQKQFDHDPYLKKLIHKVMIRNRRSDTKVQWTKRHVETIWVDYSRDEQDLYNQLNHTFQALQKVSSVTYKRELCSSREACYLSLKKLLAQQQQENMFSNELSNIIHEIEQLPHHAKALKLIELIQQTDEKFIVFTEYRATQIYLQWLLRQENILAVIYRGGFKKGKKDWMRQLFQNQAQVMIATEAAGEGINLQFCHHLVNYDLPWNPMRLEQRIGRIHRFGQSQDVMIYNFAIRNTIEEHVMKLLYKKIDMFEQLVGHLDEILQKLEVDDFEQEVKQIFQESQSDGETRIKLENLTSAIHSFHQEKQTGG